MKVSKIPGLGDFGNYVDDVDFNQLTDEEWLEIGKLHINGLVTILRNVTMSKDQFYNRIPTLGPMKSNLRGYFIKKYGGKMYDATLFDPNNPNSDIDPSDRQLLIQKKHLLEPTEGGNYLTRVSGKLDQDGNALGVFSSGELKWHSNESSSLTFSPGVALLGGEHMTGSSTGFVQTVNLYESLSSSFKSELDEMVILHRYIPGRVNDRELTDLELQNTLRRGLCPVDGSEVPLVIQSPGGFKGLHYTVNTAAGIKGMSQKESDKVFKQLDQLLFTESNIFDHWYQQDNDLLLFDNSVTLHRRIGGHADRLAFRIQQDYSNLIDSPWIPYHQPEYINLYKKEIRDLVKILNLSDFKLPDEF